MAIVPKLAPSRAPVRVNPPPRSRPVTATNIYPPPEAPSQDAPHYKVGYKKPPIETRFPKNTSGNPRGRPKGARGLKTLVRELLTQKVKVRTAAGLKSMTKMEAMLHKILEQAFSGNLRALQSFVVLYQQAVPDEPPTTEAQASPATIEDLNEHDRAMLDELRSTLVSKFGDDK